MALFDRLSHQQQQPPTHQPTEGEIRAEAGAISSNPGAYLSQRGYNIPDGMTDPRQITQHLLRTGQIGQNRLMQVLRMIGAPGIR